MHANHYTSDADISVAIDSNKKKNIKKKPLHVMYITEILLKVALSTIILTDIPNIGHTNSFKVIDLVL